MISVIPLWDSGIEKEDVHDHECDKVDGAGFVQLLQVVIRVDTLRVAKGKPDFAKRNAVALQVPVRHSKGGDRLENANEAVGLEDKLPVHEPVVADSAGRARQHVGLGRLVRERGGGQAVGETAISSFFSRHFTSDATKIGRLTK